MRNSYSHILILAIVLALFTVSCKKSKTSDPDEPEVSVAAENKFTQKEILEQSVVPNPSGFSPLTARIHIKTSIPTRVKIRVIGKHGADSDVEVNGYDTLKYEHAIPLMGLYADYQNVVQLTMFNADGASLGTSAVLVQTGALSTELPEIEINVSTAAKKSGMNLISYLSKANPALPLVPFIFDAYGDIRWYLDYRDSPVLNKLAYDNGIERLRNNNFYFADMISGAIYEINMFGEILNSWDFPGYSFHHKVLEKPNGNFLVNVNKDGLSTVEDFIIEIDRNTKQIINTWDLRQSLQYSRRTLINDPVDWIHVNSVEYDQSDNTIIVSGRTQGVIKLDQNNKVVWILSPHRGWGMSGDGVDLTTKLLKPVDKHNVLIPDTGVLNGSSNHPDFEWNWYQHASKTTPAGNLSLFDNGDNRNFSGTGPYSRAVEYSIDKVNMTVKQVWQYGKERGQETYSRIVSDVDYYADVNHYVFSPGAVSLNRKYGKIVEVQAGSSQVLFEATVYAPATYNGPVTFHRTERIELYPY